MNRIKTLAALLIERSKSMGLMVNGVKTKYMILSRKNNNE